MRVVEFIEQKLEEKGWRKSHLAKKCGITPQRLNAILYEKEGLFPPSVALKAAEALDCSAMDILHLSCEELLEKALVDFKPDETKQVQITHRPFLASKAEEMITLKKSGLSYNEIAKAVGAKSGSSVYVTIKRHEEKQCLNNTGSQDP